MKFIFLIIFYGYSINIEDNYYVKTISKGENQNLKKYFKKYQIM